jgi:hypothetical protein
MNSFTKWNIENTSKEINNKIYAGIKKFSPKNKNISVIKNLLFKIHKQCIKFPEYFDKELVEKRIVELKELEIDKEEIRKILWNDTYKKLEVLLKQGISDPTEETKDQIDKILERHNVYIQEEKYKSYPEYKKLKYIWTKSPILTTEDKNQ